MFYREYMLMFYLMDNSKYLFRLNFNKNYSSKPILIWCSTVQGIFPAFKLPKGKIKMSKTENHLCIKLYRCILGILNNSKYRLKVWFSGVISSFYLSYRRI